MHHDVVEASLCAFIWCSYIVFLKALAGKHRPSVVGSTNNTCKQQSKPFLETSEEKSSFVACRKVVFTLLFAVISYESSWNV